MGICDYYDSLAEEALGISFNEIVASEAHRDWCAGYEFSEYVGSRYFLAYYNRLCELNRERGYYNDEIDHLRSLPVLDHFIIVCEMEALKWWQCKIESAHEWLLETE